MSIMKKMAAGSYATLLTLILAVASLIVYLVNIMGEGYFQNASVTQAVIYPVVAILLLAVAFVLAQCPAKGALEKVFDILSGAMRIAAPVCLILAAMMLVSDRVEGFAFIFFSNEEVLQEVQTAANMSSTYGAITNIVLLAVAAVAGIVAAFLRMRKSEK